MEGFIDWLIELPVLCKIGLCWAFALLLVPFAQCLSYRRDCKKYGKKYADEMARRY